jgi:hypothetical protein
MLVLLLLNSAMRHIAGWPQNLISFELEAQIPSQAWLYEIAAFLFNLD